VAARYLVRLDDACHTMAAARWQRVEQILDAHGVQPIVAVIPDNRDAKLAFDPPAAEFWRHVRAWATKGWTIGLHGHTHVMHEIPRPPLLPFYRRSEFAGLNLQEQSDKLRASWQRFLANGVEPQVWVAPAHSFDLGTLQALRSATPIRVISDGLACDTFREHDFDWIPQQLWSFVERRSGLWTVCLHPNTMNEVALAALDRSLDRFGDRLTRFQDVAVHQRAKTAVDRLYSAYFWWRWRRSKPAH
jgi:predicted deacetylase